MSLKQKIKDICALPDGVDLVGAAPVERFEELPRDKRPEQLLPGTKTVIVLGSQVFKVLTDRLTADNKVGKVSPRDIYEAHNLAVINDLTQTSYRIARYLTNQGFTSVNLGQDLTDYRTISSVFSFKYAATAAGLGVLGKNGLVITPSYGPRVKLTALLTKAQIKPDEMVLGDPCEGCSTCIKVCPSGALKEPQGSQRVKHDRFVCCSFYAANQGCGLCMSKCPR